MKWNPFKRKPKFRVIYMVLMDDYALLEASSETPVGPRILEVVEYPAAEPAPEGAILKWASLPRYRQESINTGVVTLTWVQLKSVLEGAE